MLDTHFNKTDIKRNNLNSYVSTQEIEFFIKKLSIEKYPGLNGFISSGLEDLVLSPTEKGESGFIYV